MAPPGYNSREGAKRIVDQYRRYSLRPDPLYGGVDSAGWEKVVGEQSGYCGQPGHSGQEITRSPQRCPPGILGVWTNDGTIGHADTMRCLALMEHDVLPAVREMGKELGLPGPFEQAP